MCYVSINSDLAIGKNNIYENDLNVAINNFKLDDDIIVYRGTNEKYYLNHKVGDIFEGKVFYSTSTYYDQAKAFAEDITMYDDNGYKGVLLEIKVPKNSKALYIGKNSDYEINEKELLLSNKTKYRVEIIEKGKIILEVVTNGY